MIFLINHSTVANPELLTLSSANDLDVFIWNNEYIKNPNSFIPNSYHSLSGQDILFTLKASLKESKNVLVSNGHHLPKFYDHDLKKQRLFIQNSEFIFLSPRASFFFKPPLASISINSFLEFEAVVKKWGK